MCSKKNGPSLTFVTWQVASDHLLPTKRGSMGLQQFNLMN